PSPTRFPYTTLFRSGASGSGKTVLMKCMVGLMTPEHGQVLFDGTDVLKIDKKELKEIRTQIGMLFQGSALFDSMNVEHNIRFPRSEEHTSELQSREN